MQGFAGRIATVVGIVALSAVHLHAQSVTISPGYINIGFGQTQQYSATVTGLTPATVKWAVTAGGGTITQTGLYTAPLKVPANGALISATSIANPSIAAYDYVNPEPPGPTILTMTPNPLPVGNDTITITTSVSTPFIKGASMLCSGAGLTTKLISATAVSAVDYVPSYLPSITCTVTNPGYMPSNALTVPIGSVATPAPVVSPAKATVGLGDSKQFSASNATSWKAVAGTITSAGLYTAPSVVTSNGIDTITATGTGGSSTATVTLVAPVVLSPPSATAVLGTTVQFSATNATAWTATYGTVTSAGLYTAPAIMPGSGTDTVNATGAGGTGSAIVTLQNYPPPVIASITPPALPLGTLTAVIAGTGFTPSSAVTLGGTPLTVISQSSTSLGVSGFAPTSGPVTLIVSNGSAASAPFTVQVGILNAQVSAAAARRFLEQAAFGPTPSDAANVQTLGFQGWLNQQFAMPQISNYNAIAANSQGGFPGQFLVNATMNPDQLRQKVAFALSQIFVTSINTVIWNGAMVPYQQMLMGDAFTNYRQILGDVTVSPTMGQYLDMANNAMANPATGTVANENYAREVMQLFTIGTSMLNPDGTPQLDGNGLLVPTYTQTTVSETARVFTGWTYQPSSGPVEWGDYINDVGPMVPFPSEHDGGSKQLLNGYAAPAGLSPQQDLDGALDNIFNHPNVGPFVTKMLIQHLVKSNPSPAYVQRVAAVFANDGNGVRGDMQAIITAILLDPEARANDNGGNDQPGDGHLQEPMLYVAGIIRAFGGTAGISNYFGWDLVNMSQDVYNAPSVFNYYSPTFMPPGGSQLGPEFEIYTPDSAIYRANMVSNLFSSWSNPVLNYGPATNIDVTPYLALAANPASLVAALDLTLTHGTMPAAMKQDVIAAVSNDSNGNLSRVLTGAWVILSSGYYNVWH
jgi:uncharacterized protein (DUF1800 family)